MKSLLKFLDDGIELYMGYIMLIDLQLPRLKESVMYKMLQALLCLSLMWLKFVLTRKVKSITLLHTTPKKTCGTTNLHIIWI